jgi:DNA-binding PadR family transcriptional regulator
VTKAPKKAHNVGEPPMIATIAGCSDTSRAPYRPDQSPNSTSTRSLGRRRRFHATTEAVPSPISVKPIAPPISSVTDIRGVYGTAARDSSRRQPRVARPLWAVWCCSVYRDAHPQPPMTTPRDLPEADTFLPLPTAVFHILVALADRDRHGYSIMQDVATRTDDKVRLSAGTLYSAIRRMLEQGLIEELRDSPDPASADQRRRYYRLTKLGRHVALAEARRVRDMLSQAQATGLIPRKL